MIDTEIVQCIRGRTLVAPELFDMLAARIAADEHMDTDLAERIVDQALAFLGACAVSTRRLSPSEIVDIGWHAFILHTKDYREFCDRLAGGFIDHFPTGRDSRHDGGDAGKRSSTLSASLSAMCVAEAGFIVDEQLWANTGKCSQCHNGCHNDPPPNPKAA